MAERTESTSEDVILPLPRDEEAIAEAESAAERLSNPDRPMGKLGRPMDRRSSFYLGVTGTAGALLAIGTAYLIVVAADILVLIGLAFFIAIALQPTVTFFVGRGLPRGVSVAVVVIGVLTMLVGFVTAAVAPLIDEGGRLVRQVSDRLAGLNDPGTTLGGLNQRFHLTEQANALVNGGAAGHIVVTFVIDTLVVTVLSIYFLADLPRVRGALFRLAPASRRPRVILIGDEVCAKVGAYLAGNVLISLIAGAVSFVWLVIFDVPYALLLAVVVAVLDLVPVVGTLVAGALVAVMALSVSVPTCVTTLVFLTGYKIVEDYLLLPKIIGRALSIPAIVTVVAVLIGGALLGPIGALIAIPIAAAVLLVVREVSIPRLDQA